MINSELVIKKGFQEVLILEKWGSPGQKGQKGILCKENTYERMK